MVELWDFSSWGLINAIAVLLISILLANTLKRLIPALKRSLIPTSVLGGTILLLISTIYDAITGISLFNTAFFGYKGLNFFELITYHCLALGFIATAFKPTKRKFTKERNVEIFNTGVTTVATYLIQGIFGLGVTLLIGIFVSDFFVASGILLPFGFGQGTGQAYNFGFQFEKLGFNGGTSFGLSIAALGFLTASFGGVIHLNILKKKGKIKVLSKEELAEKYTNDEIQNENEIPMNGNIDKLTVQLGLVVGTYMVVFALMYGISRIIPSMEQTIFGFNFLFGVLIATLFSVIHNFLRRKNILKKQYVNEFLMNRISGFFFDVMVVAGIAAIKLKDILQYWHVLLVLALLAFVVTYFYNYFIARKFFPGYAEEQFLAMYGMLTGTASTGIILLREIDAGFETPAADNLVYQNLPAIIFGFPLMFLVNMAPSQPVLVFGILVAFFAVMNIILFRASIFKKRKKKENKAE